MKKERMRIKLASMLVVGIFICAIFIGVLFEVKNAGASEFHMDSYLRHSHASFWGEDAADNAGRSIAGAGDVNGDGYDDILIGASWDEEGGNSAGQTYLIFGKPSGWAMDTDLSNADASFWGEDGDDHSGCSVAGAGDVNGDGYDDILIGAYGDEDGGFSAGQVYLIFGKPSGWAMDTDLSTANASFWGEDANDDAGYSVAGAGDVNGDDYDDILIGAPYNDHSGNAAGQVYLIFGRAAGWAMDIDLSLAGASFRGEDPNDYAGYSVAGAGDVNQDGYDDILIGAEGDEEGGGADAGQVYLILGKPFGWSMDTNLTNADASFRGEDAGDEAGQDVAGAGDVNGDGYDDILISANADDDAGTNAGQTYLIFGQPSGWLMDRDLSDADASFLGEDLGDMSGESVAGAGDVNGDGYDDILIGAIGSGDSGFNAGQTYLILGKPSGWAMDTDLSNSDASFLGDEFFDRSGFSVAGAGNVNGDGYDDIIIGAFWNDDGGSNAGQTYLIFYKNEPTAPENLSVALSQDGTHLNLSWDASDFWKNLTGYKVYRSEDGMMYHELAVLGPNVLWYEDTDVILGHFYRYAVTATAETSVHKESPMSLPVEIMCEYDTDMDGIGNTVDMDDDGDGISDDSDAFSLDDSEWLDTDCDGIGNIADTDDDNDNIPDVEDDFPLNPFNDLESFLRAELSDLSAQYSIINDSIATLSDTVENENQLTRSEILNRINDSIAQIMSLDVNTTAHDSDIKSALNSLTNLVENEHDLTKTQLLSNLTEILSQLQGVESSILGDMEEIDQSLESIEDETKDTKDAQDSISMIVLIVLVLVILALIISLAGISLALKGNKMLKQALGDLPKRGIPPEEELETGEELEDRVEEEPEEEIEEDEEEE